MKKILNLLSICAVTTMLLTLPSCQSSSKTTFSVYDVDGEPLEKTTEDGEPTDSKQSSVSTSKNDNQKKNRFVLFNFAKNKFVETDTCGLFTTTSFGNLKKHTANITIDPKTMTAGFGSAYMAAYYVVLLTKDSRTQLATAVESYLSDFDEKKLDRKSTKSFKAYGSNDGRIEWGTVRSMLNNNGDVTVNFGYKFKKDSPYFTISIYPIRSSRLREGDSVPDESLPLNYYFTKAQAQTLVSLLQEDLLQPEFDNYIDETSSSILDWILPEDSNKNDESKKVIEGDEY